MAALTSSSRFQWSLLYKHWASFTTDSHPMYMYAMLLGTYDLKFSQNLHLITWEKAMSVRERFTFMNIGILFHMKMNGFFHLGATCLKISHQSTQRVTVAPSNIECPLIFTIHNDKFNQNCIVRQGNLAHILFDIIFLSESKISMESTIFFPISDPIPKGNHHHNSECPPRGIFFPIKPIKFNSTGCYFARYLFHIHCQCNFYHRHLFACLKTCTWRSSGDSLFIYKYCSGKMAHISM